VVGQGGDLRGYRWGVHRKAALLKAEANGRSKAAGAVAMPPFRAKKADV
jgi:hypothetical protein